MPFHIRKLILKVLLAIVYASCIVYIFIHAFPLQSKAKRASVKDFYPILSEGDQELLLRTLERFDELMTESKIPYIMEGGTLLGSFRHHGLIPWDDDVDVMVNASDRTRLVELLPKMKPDFNLFTPVNQTWKFYDATSKHLRFKPFRWPYVDIFFWNNNDTHMFHEIQARRSSFTAPIKKVLPPVRRKFAHLSLPAPCNLADGLQHFNVDICVSPGYSHVKEKYISRIHSSTMPCSELRQQFGFVQHTRMLDGQWRETMIYRGSVVYSVITPPYC